MTSASASKATPHNPFIGKVMGGRYQVDRLIGRGGMGLVYLGRELLDDRKLVLKMLAPHWADDPSAVGRFEREGKRLGELRHPNIVELFDIGHEDDSPYIVMEFIRGIPLRKVLKTKGRLSAAEFFPIAAQMLEAVAYAHDKGVMLRDIKPSNVMLCTADGKANFVKVLDFGLAKMVDGDDVEVTKSNVIGTAGFLAPELIRGGEIDVRVDVYALAIMFFIMLTGSSPILGENDGAILYNHVHGTPRAFEDVLPDGIEVPGLRGLVYKAMAKEPSERHANAGEMLEDLRGLIDEAAFDLPVATEEEEALIDRYWARKFEGKGLSDDDPSSALWTRPRLQKLLEGDADDAAAVAASDEDPYGTSPRAADKVSGKHPEVADGPDAEGDSDPAPDVSQAEIGAPRSMPPQPSAAIRARTSGRWKPTKEPTRVGLPKVPDALEPPLPPPGARRPKPARTVASSNMERALPGPPPRRSTLQASSGPAKPGPPEPPKAAVAEPAPKDKPSITQVPTPVPMEAPSPLEGDHEVGPLHLELQPPPKRRKPREPGARSTLPIGSNLVEPDRPTDEYEIDELDLEDVEIELDDDTDLEVEIEEPDPVTDPVAPVTQPPASLKPVPPIMAAAEPAPQTKGIGGLLAAAVGAALLIGGVVTWLALRSEDPIQTAAADPTEPSEAEAVPGDAQPEPEARAAAEEDGGAPAVEPVDDGVPVDPDAPGTIKVEGPDGAEAFVNDESVGTVPASVSRKPGLYTIRVEASGYEDWSTDVQLQPDGHAKLVAANQAKAPTPAGRPNRRRPSGSRPGSSKPAASKPVKPDPVSEPKPPPAETKPEPPPKKDPKPAEDDVFMKRGDKKDDGIFLPVGK